MSQFHVEPERRPTLPNSERMHFLSLRFEDGRTAYITLRDRMEKGVVLNVEGLRHVVKQTVESYTVMPAWTEKRRA